MNHEMVKAGYAWWYQKYSATDMTLKALEESARKSKKGLWVQESPEAPWEWRKRKRSQVDRSTMAEGRNLLDLARFLHQVAKRYEKNGKTFYA